MDSTKEERPKMIPTPSLEDFYVIFSSLLSFHWMGHLQEDHWTLSILL